MQPATEPPDPEVTTRRTAAVVAGHRDDEPAARSALDDPADVVREAALGALDRMGKLDDGTLVAALEDRAPAVRRRAAELAATHPAVGLVPLLDDADPSVVEMAAWGAGEQQAAAAVLPLIALVPKEGGHHEPLCREAAVAALGAIGDPRGLAAVLGALEDKPAIRRRAAVALAAFDGPEVDAALERCRSDRDWQVREVAEILTAER